MTQRVALNAKEDSNPTRMVNTLISRKFDDISYVVIGHEAEHRWLVGLLDSLNQAKRLAMATWDDALPRNSIYVYKRDGLRWRKVGYACMGGDSAEWVDSVQED